MPVLMQADGECRTYTGDLDLDLDDKPLCQCTVEGVTLFMYGKPHTLSPNETIMTLPLPLPFGKRLLCAPIAWQWSDPAELDVASLGRLLKQLFADEDTTARPPPLMLDLTDAHMEKHDTHTAAPHDFDEGVDARGDSEDESGDESEEHELNLSDDEEEEEDHNVESDDCESGTEAL